MSEVLARAASGRWERIEQAPYLLESELQALLAAQPALIPGVPDGSWTCRELNTPAGPVDVIAVDADGQVTIVECKLGRNPQVRREVVGQLIDYASRLWQMGVDEFESLWSRTHDHDTLFAGGEDEDARQRLAESMAAGRFRLVIAVDHINEPLRTMIEYLNSITRDEVVVIAVEYVRYRFGETELLTPRTFGLELAEVKISRDARKRGTWTAGEIREWVAEHEAGGEVVFDELEAALEALGAQYIPGHGGSPSGTFALGIGALPLARIVQVAVASGALVELNFDAWLSAWPDGPAREAVARLLDDLREIPALEKAVESIRAGVSKRKSVPLREFGFEDTVAAFARALDRFARAAARATDGSAHG